MTSNPNVRVIAPQSRVRLTVSVSGGRSGARKVMLTQKALARLGLVFMFCVASLQSLNAEEIEWRTAKQLSDQLASPVSISWSAANFRPALERLSRAQRVAILVDRRIDPGTRCEFRGENEALSEVYRHLAEQANAGYSQLGPVAYFGPESTARKLRTLAAQLDEQVEQLPPTAKRIWHRSRAWHWNDFATPRQLLEGLATEHRIKLVGLEQIPHDLWAEADVPPMPLAERMLLIAAQYDFTLAIEPDGRSASLVSIPSEVAVQRRYSGRGKASQLARQYRGLVPDAEVVVDGRDVVVSGLIEEHERIANGQSSTETQPTSGTQVFRLKVENIPVVRLLDHVSKQMGYEVETDEKAISSAGLSLDERVSVDVKDATIQELLEAILKPAGLAHRREGKRIEVFPNSP